MTVKDMVVLVVAALVLGAIPLNIIAAPFVSLGRLRRLLAQQGYELRSHERLNAYVHDGSPKWVDAFSFVAVRDGVEKKGFASMKNFFLVAGTPVITWESLPGRTSTDGPAS